MSVTLLISDGCPPSSLTAALTALGRIIRADTSGYGIPVLRDSGVQLVVLYGSSVLLKMQESLRYRRLLANLCPAVVWVTDEQLLPIRGADLVLPGHLDEERYYFLLENLVFRTLLRNSQNPLTGLPGNPSILADYKRRCLERKAFSVAVIDIDGFKAFNDVFGSSKGDDALLLLSRLLRHQQSIYPRGTLFAGHIGGDDFYLSGPPDLLRRSLRSIIRRYSLLSLAYFTPEQRRSGYFLAISRYARMKKHPLLKLSVALVHARETIAYADLFHELARLKRAAKVRSGWKIAESELTEVTKSDLSTAT